jgi:hypothetical protein
MKQLRITINVLDESKSDGTELLTCHTQHIEIPDDGTPQHNSFIVETVMEPKRKVLFCTVKEVLPGVKVEF